MQITVPVDVAIVLERYRLLATLMDDSVGDEAIALLVIASLLIDDG